MAVVLIAAVFASSCASTDQARLKASREAYVRDDFAAAETALYGSEVYENEQNRLLHYYMLASVSMGQGHYEKSIYFLDRARELAISLRSDSGLFEMFSSDYKSNPVEYSTLHAMLVISYTMLASEGRTEGWVTPEIKDKKGNILVQGMSVPARVFSPREIAEFRQKVRAELLAWDTFLETLKRSNSGHNTYHEDLWARLLASFVHGVSGNNNERRTSELLASQAIEILHRTAGDLPSREAQRQEIEALASRLGKRARSRGDASSLVVIEAGVMSPYKIRRFHLGLTTLVGHIQDPFLRSQIESIGLQIILNTAPEFGLILFAGGLAGATTGHDEDSEFEGPPRFFSEAVDRSFGFEIRFPSLQAPPAGTRVHLQLTRPGEATSTIAMPIVSPLQEILSVELQKRQDHEMFERAIRVGLQYLGVLLPAIQAYRAADREGNVFKKLAVLAGFYISKKVIDNANRPDLRSWNTLPKLIAAQIPELKPGVYDGQVIIENQFGRHEAALGALELGNPARPILRRRVGNVDILNRRILKSGAVDPKQVP